MLLLPNIKKNLSIFYDSSIKVHSSRDSRTLMYRDGTIVKTSNLAANDMKE
jgi:hypothetical protein